MTRSGIVVTFLSISVAGCVNPLPFGPGRVAVATEDVRITRVANRELFGDTASRPDQTREAILFDLSSETDFRSYFKGRQIQIRCAVDHSTDNDRITIGYGPFHEHIDLSRFPEPGEKTAALTPRARDGRYSYRVYAFVDLSATQLIDHSFRDFPLEPMGFSELSCFVIGVAKAPVLFPRSNDFGVGRELFLKLLEIHRSRRATAENTLPADGR